MKIILNRLRSTSVIQGLLIHGLYLPQHRMHCLKIERDKLLHRLSIKKLSNHICNTDKAK